MTRRASAAERALRIALWVGVALGAGLFVWSIAQPENPVLWPVGGGGHWIRFDEPFGLAGQPIENDTVEFRASFTASPELLRRRGGVELDLRTLRSHRLTVNGRPVPEPQPSPTPWRSTRRVDLAGLLVPGLNEIRVAVDNDRGPPALAASSAVLGLRSGPEWRASRDGRHWTPALPVAEGRRPALALEFPTTLAALSRTWPAWLALFLLGAAASLILERPAVRSSAAVRLITAARARWLLLGTWTLLCLHDLNRVHPDIGFDVRQHLQYIVDLLNRGRLPLASEGWQAFQPPLYYQVAAIPLVVFAKLFSLEAGQLAVRGLSMACGLALIELTFRAARSVLPGRPGLQIVATVVGGFLPMSVYMCQYAGNEPLAAVFTAALLVRAFGLLMEGAGAKLGRESLVLGSLLGLAVLTKVTAALLAPLLVGLVAWTAVRATGSPRAALAPLAGLLGSAAAISGWYFVRNRVALGHFYVGGWDPSRGYPWWQHPGYRLPGDFVAFGESLTRPVLSSFAGVWDGLYSTLWLDGFLSSMVQRFAAPPWSYDTMVALAPLSLPLAAAGAFGAARTLWPPRVPAARAVRFAAICLATYVLAIVALFASLPVYSTTKGTYMLGLAPCYGLVIAWGFAGLPAGRVGRALLSGYLVAWLGFVLRAFWA